MDLNKLNKTMNITLEDKGISESGNTKLFAAIDLGNGECLYLNGVVTKQKAGKVYQSLPGFATTAPAVVAPKPVIKRAAGSKKAEVVPVAKAADTTVTGNQDDAIIKMALKLVKMNPALSHGDALKQAMVLVG